MSQALSYPLQSLGAGDKRALAAKEYTGLVIAAYQTNIRILPNTWSIQINSGSQIRTTATGKMQATRHEDGKYVGSGQVKKEARLLNIDEQELKAMVEISYKDKRMSHLPDDQIHADEAGQAIAEALDLNAGRMGIIGSRQPRSGTVADRMPGGVTVRRNGATLDEAYPMSVAGSKRLQEDLKSVGRVWFNNNVQGKGKTWIAYVGGYLMDVLAMDTALMNRLYDAQERNPNSLLMNSVGLVAGFQIIPVTNLPDREYTANSDDPEPQYLGNFEKTAVFCQASPMGVARSMYDEINAEPPYDVKERRVTIVGATSFGGFGWQKKAELAEIHFGNSDYTVGANGVKTGVLA